MAKQSKQAPIVEQDEQEQSAESASAEAAPKTTKSIVPAKYAGRYKSGGSDALAEFIKAQCNTKDGFDFPKFFELCKANGVPAEKVDHYAGQVAEKRHGAQGRARMTLRNMLATIARKDGKLKDLGGEEVSISLPKPMLSGAAKAQAEAGQEQSAGQF
jgi:hypothetical protein